MNNPRAILAVAAVFLVVTGASTSVRLQGQLSVPESLQGMLADGSSYRVVKPAQWNGTIVLDLDFANNLNAPPSVIERWMTANGYAIGGISREPVA